MLYSANSQLHKRLWSGRVELQDLINIKLIVWPSYNNFNALLNHFTAVLGQKTKLKIICSDILKKKNNNNSDNNKKRDKNNKQTNEKKPQKRNTTNTVESQRKEEPQNWETVSFVVGKRGP